MVLRQPIIKHNDLRVNINLYKIWEAIKQHSPSILKSPLALFSLALQLVNKLIITFLFLVLLGQTIYILNGSQRRYINLRHLLIKWISLVVIIILAGYIKKHTTYDDMFELMCNMFAIAMVYPSKFIKNLHLKYFSFSQRKKYEESTEENGQLDMSLMTRMLSSLTIFFLNICRYTITFIAPQHRKKIQEAMRGVNLVIVQEKYFWKMYQTSAKGSIVIPSTTNQSAPAPIQGGRLSNSGFLKKSSVDMIKQIPKSPKSALSGKENAIRAKVAEVILEPVSSLNLISQRKFQIYRNIEIVYSCETGQMTIINQEDGKSTVHDLVEFNEENNLILKFGFDNEDFPLFAKFRNKREYDLFYNTLYLQAQYQDAR